MSKPITTRRGPVVGKNCFKSKPTIKTLLQQSSQSCGETAHDESEKHFVVAEPE